MLRSALVVGLSLAFVTSAADTADAQSRRSNQMRSTFRLAPLKIHPVGAYGGVQPGVARAKAYKDRPRVVNKSKRKNVVRWIGFQQKESGSRIFVQLTGEVEYSQRVEGSDLIVTLDRARLGGSNARRPLYTRFFETAISKAVAKRKRKRVEIRISFKNPKDAAPASASMSKSDEDGFTYLFLDFGVGSSFGDGDADADADADDSDGDADADESDDE